MLYQHIRNGLSNYGLSALLNKTGWALVDQAVVSVGMFFANVILARHLTTSEYGLFALLLTVGFSAQLLAQGLSGYQLILRLAPARGDERARLMTNSILETAGFCVPLSFFVVVAASSLGHPELILPALSWSLLWQMQQATRRALLIDLRQREAAIGDAISSLVQVLLLVLVGSRGSLSLAHALYCMSAGSLIGAVIQALQLRLTTKALYVPYRWLIDNAALVLSPLAAAVVWTLRGYAMFWLLAAFSGTVAVASLQAALTVFNLCNPLSASLVNIVGVTAARAFNGVERQPAWRAARPYVLIALPPMLLYLGAALIFHRFLLASLYGNDSAYVELGYLFPYLAIATAVMIPAELITSFLLGIRETRLVLRTILIAVSAVALLLPPIFATFGMLEGTCLALACGEVVRLTLLSLGLRQLINDGGTGFTKTQAKLSFLQRAWAKPSI